MRLINCRTYQLEEFLDLTVPRYAILSHTWGEEEVTFADFTTNLAAVRSRPQFRKIAFTCRQALAEGIDYAWVDTACIDKSSSAELSEAINSMFKWYAGSVSCYAYLIDVLKDNFDEYFPQSRWFRRGWTLQELLAPRDVVFFDSAWQCLGSKLEHAGLIYNITQIDEEALKDGGLHKELSEDGLEVFCVAKRMAWASQRETTRVEDMAYCLLGIFNVNMPLLYGEGDKAFLRLQQEIIKSLDDDSILAWGLMNNPVSAGMPHCVVDAVNEFILMGSILARSPRDFANCHDLSYASTSISPFSMTNMGLQIELPLVPIQTPRDSAEGHGPNNPAGWVGLLTCSTSNPCVLLGIVLDPFDKSDMLADRVIVKHESDEHTAMTVLIGPKVAAQAIPMKITIAKTNESRMVRSGLRGLRQFIPVQTVAFRSFGYNITIAKGYEFPTTIENSYYCAVWNPSEEILTVTDDPDIPELVWFSFQSENSQLCPEFSVMIQKKKLIVRRGILFSDDQLAQFYQLLIFEDEKVLAEEEGIILEDNYGQRMKVHVKMLHKRVHHWVIEELLVDAVPC